MTGLLGQMNSQNEHDDDLEPEVIEGAEIETETYGDTQGAEDTELGTDVTNQSGGSQSATEIDEEENSEDEARDSI
jgi:hypothetical protein